MGQVCITETSLIHKECCPHERNDGWGLDEWNDDWSCVEWRTDVLYVCNFIYSLESSEWVNTNLDTGAAVNTFLVDFDRERVGDGSLYDWIPYGDLSNFKDMMKMANLDL